MAKLTFEGEEDAHSYLTDVINLDIDGVEIDQHSPPEGKATDTFVDVYVTVENRSKFSVSEVGEKLESALEEQAYADFDSVTVDVRDISP